MKQFTNHSVLHLVKYILLLKLSIGSITFSCPALQCLEVCIFFFFAFFLHKYKKVFFSPLPSESCFDFVSDRCSSLLLSAGTLTYPRPQKITVLSLQCSVAPELGGGFPSWLYPVHFQNWTCLGSTDGAINRTRMQQNCCRDYRGQIPSPSFAKQWARNNLKWTQMERN